MAGQRQGLDGRNHHDGSPATAHEASGDGGLATSSPLTNPTGLVFDRAGSLYIGDGARQLYVADPWNNAVRLLK
jgi:hypothetical protein